MSLLSPHDPLTAAPQLEIQAGVDVLLSLERATVGSRAAAYIADLIVLILVWLIVVLVVGLAVPFTEVGSTLLIGAIVGWFVTQWLYFGVQEAVMSGQTFGKRLIGIRVVDATGQPPGIGAALLRNILRTIDSLPYSYGVGTILVGSTEDGRRFGDILAGTHVVHDVPEAYMVPRFTAPADSSESERLLLEQWLVRATVLDPDARTRLAKRIAFWLDARWPGFLPSTGTADKRISQALQPHRQ